MRKVKDKRKIEWKLGKTKRSKLIYRGYSILENEEISKDSKWRKELYLTRQHENKLLRNLGSRSGIRKSLGLPKTGRTRTNNNTIRKKK
jgi:ribosomal protein S13